MDDIMKIYETTTKKMRPTQICVGYAEVEDKIHKLSHFNKHELDKFLRENPLPAVAGPDGEMHLTDHHHLGRALQELKIKDCYFIVQHDLSKLPDEKFFDLMKVLELIYPFDENGLERPCSEIPKHLSGLKDDPYRSLAGFVRKAGGYQKVPKAYLEFQWANFFRPLIPKEHLITHEGMKKSVVQAIDIAQSEQAKHMLGWTGKLSVLKT